MILSALDGVSSPTLKRVAQNFGLRAVTCVILSLLMASPAHAEDMDSYLAYLDTRFGSAWRMPAGCERLRAVISFVLYKNGDHTVATIDSTSGNKSFDSSCLVALQYAGPFRHMPDEAKPFEPIGVSFSSSGVDCWYKLAGGQSGSDRAIIQRKSAINKKIIELRQRLAKEEKAFGKEHPKVIATVYEIAIWCKSDNRWNEAAPLLNRVLNAQSKNPKLLRHKVSTLSDIGDMYSLKGSPEKAEPYFKEAMEIMEKNFSQEKLTLAKAMQNYAKLLYKLPGRREEADQIFEKIKDINSPKGATAPVTAPNAATTPTIARPATSPTESTPSSNAAQNPWRSSPTDPNPWRSSPAVPNASTGPNSSTTPSTTVPPKPTTFPSKQTTENEEMKP